MWLVVVVSGCGLVEVKKKGQRTSCVQVGVSTSRSLMYLSIGPAQAHSTETDECREYSDSRPVLYITPAPVPVLVSVPAESDHLADDPSLPEHARPHLHVASVGCVLAPWQHRARSIRVRRRSIGRLRLRLLRLLVLVPIRHEY